MPGIFAAISFTPSRAFFLSAAETPSFHLITDTWMMVFGVPKLFCAASHVAAELIDISAISKATRTVVFIATLLPDEVTGRLLFSMRRLEIRQVLDLAHDRDLDRNDRR